MLNMSFMSVGAIDRKLKTKSHHEGRNSLRLPSRTVCQDYNQNNLARHCNYLSKKLVRASISSYIPEAARKSNIPEESLGQALEAAMKEAMDDATFRKIKRCSYAPRSEDVVGQILGKAKNRRSSNVSNKDEKMSDPQMMEQLLQALLGQVQARSKDTTTNISSGGRNSTTPHDAFNRLRPMSRSMRAPSLRGRERRRSSAFNQGINLPTIMERSNTPKNNSRPMSLSERAMNAPGIRNILQTIGTNVPQRLQTDEGSPNRGRRGSESTTSLMHGQP